MRGDPQAEVTAVCAALQTAVGTSLQRATSAGVTDRNDVTATLVSAWITVNPGMMRDFFLSCSSPATALPLQECLLLFSWVSFTSTSCSNSYLNVFTTTFSHFTHIFGDILNQPYRHRHKYSLKHQIVHQSMAENSTLFIQSIVYITFAENYSAQVF